MEYGNTGRKAVVGSKGPTALTFRRMMMDSQHTQLPEDLAEHVVEAVRAAAVPVMERFRSAQKVWDKSGAGDLRQSEGAESPNNPVSEADLLADAVLKERLCALLPEAGWLSEETADSPDRLQRACAWIVDPIDGTREYTEGVDQFALSVGLAVQGTIHLGVLLNPARNDLFVAERGKGCIRNGLACTGSTRTALSGARLLASRTEARRGEFTIFSDKMVIQEMGSTAYKLALAAAGEGDAYFTRKPRNEWDVAAGILLCTEAGLTVTDLGGAPHRFNRPDPLCRGVVAASKGIHAEIMASIAAVGTLE